MVMENPHTRALLAHTITSKEFIKINKQRTEGMSQ